MDPQTFTHKDDTFTNGPMIKVKCIESCTGYYGLGEFQTNFGIMFNNEDLKKIISLQKGKVLYANLPRLPHSR